MISSTYYHKGMHLTAGQISRRHEICPFCSAGNFRKIFTVQRDPDIYLMKCSHCHGVFAGSVPSDAVFQEYYSSYYAEGEPHTTFNSPQRFARRIYKALTIEKGGGYRILDFGGGDGSLSYALAKMILSDNRKKIEITVVDYTSAITVSSEPSISLTHCDSLDSVNGSYDIIIASSILEHLPQPVAIIKQLFGKLSDGGFFYARHPYIVPLMRVVGKAGINIDFTYPAHLNDFGGDFWKVILGIIFDEGSCSIVFSRPSPVETSWRAAPLRTLVAYSMKSLWYLSCGLWHFVGGWEIGIVKKR
jgi:SAM-dependent methyltransferase